jgi:hypothetical protein
VGVSALGVTVETCHHTSKSAAIRHCPEVEDLVQNVIGPAAARTYPGVGSAGRSVIRICARIRGMCCEPSDIGHRPSRRDVNR